MDCFARLCDRTVERGVGHDLTIRWVFLVLLGCPIHVEVGIELRFRPLKGPMGSRKVEKPREALVAVERSSASAKSM